MVIGRERNANCVFDVMVTGEPGFARAYQATQKIMAGATAIHISDSRDPRGYRQPLMFTAIVVRKLSRAPGAPTGTVQFELDGKRVGKPIKLNSRGRAVWRTTYRELGDHKVTARYIPRKGSIFLASTGASTSYSVRR